MKTKRVRLAIMVASILGTASCIHLWNAGPPCIGNGCPAGRGGQLPSATQQAQAQPAAGSAQQAENAAPAGAEQAADSQAPAQSADGSAAAASAPANPAPAQSSQANGTQAKPGRLTRMLEALHLHSKN